MNNKTIHICYATDANYAKLACMSMHDVCLHKEDTTNIVFHILLDRVQSRDMFLMFNSIEGVEVRTYQTDTTSLIGDIPIYAPIKSHAISLRLFIPLMKNFENIHRILYLDSDVMARRDLSDLYSIDLRGYPIGWVKDQLAIEVDIQSSKPILKYEYKDFFANSGVILMDLDKLRNSRYPQEWINMYKNICSDDQIVMNNVNHHTSYHLPPTYNLFYQYFPMRIKNSDNIDRWNKYHGTGYSSVEEIINTSYLWHFADEKRWILRDPIVNKIWVRWAERCNSFLHTGILAPWSEDDQKEFLIRNVSDWFAKGKINEHTI